MTYQETIEYLYGLQWHGIKLGLDNPRALLAEFGDPHLGLKVIHLAGTNGKGSTAAMAASILGAAGFRTGLFTSPHLSSFTERIKVNGVDIAPDEVVRLSGEISDAASRLGLTPTFFEVVAVMAFIHFRDSGVEYAVVETGMGGRLDATNVVRPAVSVITPINFDHREFLGETLPEIAAEKAGIIKPGVPVITSRQMPDAMAEIQKKASTLFVLGRDFGSALRAQDASGITIDFEGRDLSIRDIRVPLPGAYQADNAALAIEAVRLALVASGKTHQLEEAVMQGMQELRWPGRLEKVSDNPLIYLDGAHNAAAVGALAGVLQKDFLPEGRRLVLVMGIMADKDIRAIMEPILGLASEVVFTRPDYGRAARPEELQRIAASLGHASKTAENVKEALDTAASLAGGDSMILVTGSFYTIGAARDVLAAHKVAGAETSKPFAGISDPWKMGTEDKR